MREQLQKFEVACLICANPPEKYKDVPTKKFAALMSKRHSELSLVVSEEQKSLIDDYAATMKSIALLDLRRKRIQRAFPKTQKGLTEKALALRKTIMESLEDGDTG